VERASFALDGPPKCSGLPVVRYSPEDLAAELGASFRREETARETHPTPFGSTQEFWYTRFKLVTHSAPKAQSSGGCQVGKTRARLPRVSPENGYLLVSYSRRDIRSVHLDSSR
jgi:hypothetical protein